MPGGEGDPADAAIRLIDADDLLVEAEVGAVPAGGKREVLGAQHRVVHEPALGFKNCCQRAACVVGKGRVVNSLRRKVRAKVHPRKQLLQLLIVEDSVRDVELVPQTLNAHGAVARRMENAHAGFHKASHSIRVDATEVALPIQPHRGRFPCGQHRVCGRVAEANDRRRRTGGTGTSGRPLVDHDDRSAAASQLQGDR